jgi:hypothetical protein
MQILGVLVIVIALVILFTTSGNPIVTVNSKNSNKVYLAKRKNRNGKKVDDWTYYNDDGFIITDMSMKTLIFNSFINEDWYGDFKFYVNDDNFNITTDDSKKEKSETADQLEKSDLITKV